MLEIDWKVLETRKDQRTETALSFWYLNVLKELRMEAPSILFLGKRSLFYTPNIQVTQILKTQGSTHITSDNH